MHFALIHQIA